MSNKDYSKIELNIDFENPNPMAIEITKTMLNNNLISFGSDAQKATVTFLALYSKVLFEIQKLKNNPQDLQALVEASFEEFDGQNLS